MSSGGKSGRGNKNSRLGVDKMNTGSGTTHKDTGDSHRSELPTIDKDKESLPHKIPPTAEQLRLAQMIGNTKTEPDKVLQEKLNQVMQFTGVTSDDALVALHDCDNDVNAAIDHLLEPGDAQGQWLASTKKKKKNPANKVVEAESNKENRKMDSRERSGTRLRGGGPPRFRGRGGGRGGKDGDGDGPGRGEGSRRGRMTNGGPLSRGRGGRGRGSGLGPRTFQNRQPPGFPDSIDTWGASEPAQDQQNSLKIDTWDDEPAGPSGEDWDDEWTGSLDQTTVFGPSTSVPPVGPQPPVDELIEDTLMVGGPTPVASQSFPSAAPSVSLAQPSHLELVALLQKAAPHSTLTGLGTNSHLGSVANNVGSNAGVGPLCSNAGVGPLVNNSIGALGNGTGIGSLGNGTGVGGLGSGIGPLGNSSSVGSLGGIGNGVLGSSPLGGSGAPGMVSAQHSILSSLSSNMGEALKSGGLVNTVGGNGSSVPVSVPPPYTSPTSPLQNSIFSNPGLHSVSSSLNNSINTNSVVINKSVTMPPPPSTIPTLTSRQKTQRPRIPHSSKIPLSAVEMPEDAMAALDMQFSGLEFGAETYDLNSEIKVPQSSIANSSLSTNIAVSSHSVGHVASHSVSSSVTKDLSSVTTLPPSLVVPSKLGPDPIPYPTTQTNERKPSGSSYVTSGQRSSGGSSTTQGLADLTKKDTSSTGLGSLMGSPAAPSPYQSSYTSKTSTSFPSPPSASYVPPPPHQMSSYSNSQSVVSPGGFNNSGTGSSNNTNASVNSTPNSGVYGSSFSAQVSTGSNQYQNNYVTSSSHSSLASMSTPKTLSALKDPSQSYSEASPGGGQGLSSALVTTVPGSNVSVGNSITAPSVLNTVLNTTTHHTQPSKSLPVKTVNVNSLNSNVQTAVQSHQPTHIQTHQQHHQQQHQQQQQQHQQQQQQAAQQLMAQPSQFVSPPAALQGALPPAFYNLQQPAMYSYEELQLLQQRMPHMQQAPTTITTGREGNLPSAAYTVADGKFRTDQNSSPVPSSINQQGATAGGTYITAAGNAGLPPFYMYHNVAAVPNQFPQYGTPTIIQLPPSTHTGSNSTQFPGAPKLPYGSTNYYDSVSQNPDFKTAYATATQGQNKAGAGTAGSGTNSANDLAPYKNHISKTYEKQSFHTATPPPFNMTGSGTNPMTANAYTPMFIPTIPAAQHHSPLMHHQLHQDGGSSGGQRSGNSVGQNKGGSKASYNTSYWAPN